MLTCFSSLRPHHSASMSVTRCAQFDRSTELPPAGPIVSIAPKVSQGCIEGHDGPVKSLTLLCTFLGPWKWFWSSSDALRVVLERLTRHSLRSKARVPSPSLVYCCPEQVLEILPSMVLMLFDILVRQSASCGIRLKSARTTRMDRALEFRCCIVETVLLWFSPAGRTFTCGFSDSG